MYVILKAIIGLYLSYCSYKYTKIGFDAFLEELIEADKKNSLPPSESEGSDSEPSDSELPDSNLKDVDPTKIPPGGQGKEGLEVLKKWAKKSAKRLARRKKPLGPIARRIEDLGGFFGKFVSVLLSKNPAFRDLIRSIDDFMGLIANFFAICAGMIVFKLMGLAEIPFWLDVLRKLTRKFKIKYFISALRRMKLGYPIANCKNTDPIIDTFQDASISDKRKYLKLKYIFKYYENLSEYHFLKSPYFFCIMQIFLGLFLLDNNGPFLKLIRYFTKLFVNNIISEETYHEIVSYLLNQGAHPDDFPDPDGDFDDFDDFNGFDEL